MVSLGCLAITAGLVFRIDEVITVTGQLESISGSVDIKTPVGGKIADVFFTDGQLVKKGDLLATFDTREAIVNKRTIMQLIELENEELENTQQILKSKRKIMEDKLKTTQLLTNELGRLLEIGECKNFNTCKNKMSCTRCRRN